MNRQTLLEMLAEEILCLDLDHPVRVAVDGIDAAGKTRLADELVACIRHNQCPVIRASLDGFHRPRSERYRRGSNSPEGYYLDSFDYPALRANLLLPLGLGGDLRYRQAAFDYRVDAPLDTPWQIAPARAALVIDGIFLLRPEVNDCWDYRIFLDIRFDTTLSRALVRDLELFGSEDVIRQRYQERYLPAQHMYLESVQPRRLADVVIDHNDPQAPRLLVKDEIF